MDIKTTLQPGQNGTKQLVQKYGDKLICVRYRYDKATQKRYKTVELIVDEQEWIPGIGIPPVRLVYVRLEITSRELRQKILDAGGLWDLKTNCWVMSKRKALELQLESSIIDEHLDL